MHFNRLSESYSQNHLLVSIGFQDIIVIGESILYRELEITIQAFQLTGNERFQVDLSENNFLDRRRLNWFPRKLLN